MSFLDRLYFRRSNGPLSPDGRLASNLRLDRCSAGRRIKSSLRQAPLDVTDPALRMSRVSVKIDNAGGW